MNYIYTINPDSDEPIMVINDDIGYDPITNTGVSGDQFQRELLSLDEKGKKRIKIYINSIGGNVKDGHSIFYAMVNTKTPVDTFNAGICASIAGILFLGGRNRCMVDYGDLMIHDPYVVNGDDKSQYLSQTREGLITMMSARTSISEDRISDMMSKETWLKADEALKAGFATEIINSGDNNKKRVSKKEDVYSKWSECGLIMNKVFNIKNIKEDMSIQKINAKLGLNEEAAYESTITEINKLIAIKNKLDEEGDEDDNNDTNNYDKMKMENDKLKDELKEAKDKYEDCYNKLSEFENKFEEMENKNKMDKAKDLISNSIKLGKIKNEASEKWISMAVADYTLAKDLIDELPVNKTATKIQTIDNVAKSGTNNNDRFDAVARKMVEISNKINKN